MPERPVEDPSEASVEAPASPGAEVSLKLQSSNFPKRFKMCVANAVKSTTSISLLLNTLY